MQDGGEEWRQIPGFPEYLVSDFGRVYSHRSDRVLKPGRMSGGHMSVALGRGNSRCVHELVLIAFVGPRPPKHEGRHLNGDPADNRLVNLQWATRSTNARDKKWHKGTSLYKISPADARLIRQLVDDGHSYRSLGRRFGVAHVTISRVHRRVTHVDVE